MNIYNEIRKALQKVNEQNNLYRPSSFWAKASQDLLQEIESNKIENFRKLPLPLDYFVPTFGSPANSLTIEIESLIYKSIHGKVNSKQKTTIDNFLSGYNQANSDYRVLKASDLKDKKPLLHNFSESNYGNPKEHFMFNGKRFSRSSLNYLLGLSFLKKHVPENDIKIVLEIGGGFGTLGEILMSSGINDIKYIDIDIPATSYVAWNYLSKSFPDKINVLETMLQDNEIVIEHLEAISIFNNWQIEKLKGEVDLFVNFISFQEMEPHIVNNYLKHVKRLKSKYILLRNMREGKQVKKDDVEVGVEIPILKDDYIKMIEDEYILIDSDAEVFGYKTVDGFHSELLLFKRK